MQGIENLTRLRGRIVCRAPHPARAGYDLLTLQVNETLPVEGKNDLLGRHRGATLDVAVRSELLGQAEAGAQVDLRAKMTPDGALAEPHPELGDFKLSAGSDRG